MTEEEEEVEVGLRDDDAIVVLTRKACTGFELAAGFPLDGGGGLAGGRARVLRRRLSCESISSSICMVISRRTSGSTSSTYMSSMSVGGDGGRATGGG